MDARVLTRANDVASSAVVVVDLRVDAGITALGRSAAAVGSANALPADLSCGAWRAARSAVVMRALEIDADGGAVGLGGLRRRARCVQRCAGATRRRQGETHSDATNVADEHTHLAPAQSIASLHDGHSISIQFASPPDPCTVYAANILQDRAGRTPRITVRRIARRRSCQRWRR